MRSHDLLTDDTGCGGGGGGLFRVYEVSPLEKTSVYSAQLPPPQVVHKIPQLARGDA